MKTLISPKYILFVITVIVFKTNSVAQYYNPATGDTTIYQIYNDFYNGYSPSLRGADTLEDGPIEEFMRWYNFWEPRLAPTGNFKVAAQAWGDYTNDIHSRHSSSAIFCSSGTPLPNTWTEKGININSSFTSGQVECISFDPNNSSIMYAGGLDGGVYRTTNGGSNWVNMGTDVQLLSLGISDIAVEPTNSNVVYAASGSAQSRLAFTDGVYRTTDANDGNSATWTSEGPISLSNYSDQQFIHQLAIDPLDNTLLYAAVDDPSSYGDGGIWYANNREQYTSNTPLNWTQDVAWGFSYNSIYSDAAFSVVDKIIPTRLGHQTQLYAAGYDIYEGQIGSWTSITGPNTGTGTHIIGGGLDLTPVPTATSAPFQLNATYFKDPANPSNQLYLTLIALTLSADGNYLYANIFATNNYPITWQSVQYQFIARYNFSLGGWDISPNPNSAATSTFPWALNGSSDVQGVGGWYGISRKALAVDPNNDDRIFVGTTNMSESTDGGVTWNDDFEYWASYPPPIGNGPHVDFHEIKFQPGNSNLVYVGTDGGCSSFNSTVPLSPSGLQELNNGLGFSLDCDAQSSEQDAGDIWQTMQDNSANHLENNMYTTFIGNLGDGLNNLIDYTNENNVYLQSQYNSCEIWGGGQIDYNGGYRGGDPILLNSYNPNTMYEGREDAQKCNDVENGANQISPNCSTYPTKSCWEKISDYINQIGGGNYSYVIQAMAILPTDSNYLYASLAPLSSTDYFRLTWSQNGGGTGATDWTDITPDNSNYTICGVAVSYFNPYHVWITYSGYDVNHKVKEGIYNGSTWTWTDDNNGLCNFNINCIVYENGSNDGIYIGTDAGVYYKNASMSSWQRVGTTFPNVIVKSLQINYCNHKLVAGTYGRGTWETDLVPSTSTPLQITSNTTWNAPPSGSSIMIPEDVEITSGNTLTISSGLTVNMSEKHFIIVDPGAELNVYGAITNACAGLWGGIQLNGNIALSQTSTNQGTVILNPGSTIENAINGITTNGGIILANKATFYNNQRDVQFLSYHNIPNPLINKCNFSNCTFEVDKNYIWLQTHTYSLQPRVTMWDVHGINFYNGNTFENLIPITMMSNIYSRSSGIYSIDASYSVTNCSNMIICTNGCCGPANFFTGFEFGILAANSNPAYTINITGNSFKDNFADIDIQNINNLVIEKNTFSKTTDEGTNLCFPRCAIPYNIYLDQCTAYALSGNLLTNSYYSNSYGTLINNSGIANNLINNNTFTDIYIQSQSQGVNGNYVGFPHPSVTGLQYWCNQYNQDNAGIKNGADIAVATMFTGGIIDPNQGSCASSLTTANNAFNYSNTCTAMNRWNIFADPWFFPPMHYYCSTLPQDIPTCNTPNVNVTTCASVTAPDCTPVIIIGNGGNSNYQAVLRKQKQEYKHSRDSLKAILGKGNAAGLFGAIANQPPPIVQDSLLAPGPYLSDSVLSTAALAGLPAQNLANVLIPNTTLDSAVVSTLDSVPLPDTVVNRINQFQSDSNVSPREQLIAGINYFQAQMDLTDNALITSFLMDSTIIGAFDSAQSVILSDSLTKPLFAQLASFQMAAGEDSLVMKTLDTLHSLDNDSTYYNYCRLLPVLINLRKNSIGYLALIGDAQDSSILEQIAMDTLTPGYANARAVLEFVYNQAFDEPIIPLENENAPHRPRKKNNLYIHSKSQTATTAKPISSNSFNLFPNPANNNLTIQYSLDNSVQSASIELFDEVGNKVLTWQLPTNQTQLNRNISDLAAGFYLYSIFADNKVVQRGKFIINR